MMTNPLSADSPGMARQAARWLAIAAVAFVLPSFGCGGCSDSSQDPVKDCVGADCEGGGIIDAPDYGTCDEACTDGEVCREGSCCAICKDDDDCEDGTVCATYMGERECTLECNIESDCTFQVGPITADFSTCGADETPGASRDVCLPDPACYTGDPLACFTGFPGGF